MTAWILQQSLTAVFALWEIVSCDITACASGKPHIIMEIKQSKRLLCFFYVLGYNLSTFKRGEGESWI